MKSSEPLIINKTSILQYDKQINCFTLYVPIEKKSINIPNRNKCGIDPGVRTFLTCYADKEILEIGHNCHIRYKKYYDKIDKIRELNSKNHLSSKNFKKAINRRFDKIYNLTKDLHFKSSKYLCHKFDEIIIGKISTSKIVSKNNDLNKKSKRAMLSLSHFKFREILEYQCFKYNCKLKIVNEAYTSKTCHNCKQINNIGKSKTFECSKCKLKCDRDINASINIFNK